MHRPSKWFPFVLALCLWWASGMVEAEGGAKSAKPQQPAGSQAGQAAQPPQEAPSINIPETVYDFGEIMEGTEVTHEFKVSNTGKSALQIEQVRPG